MKKIMSTVVIGMLLLSLFMVTSASENGIIDVLSNGDTLYVGGNGSSNYTSIQDAINASSNDDTIFVYAGTYCENVIVNKSIDLVGEDKDNTIIDAIGSIYALRINASDVSINGFTIKNATNGYGIEIYKSNNTIIDNIIKENGFGLEIGLSSNNIISSNTITDNLAIGIDLCTLATNNMIIKNSIINNGEDPFIGYGLAISDSSDNNTIYHNNFIDNKHNVVDDCNNTYDDGSEGNYWDNYAGIDADKDGIGDTPYNISGGDNKDYYPLMQPFGSVELSINIAPFDLGKISAFIRNIGDFVVSNVEWSISVKGGIFKLINISANGTIDTIDSDMSEKVTTGFNSIARRLGTVTIDVELKAGAYSFNETFYGFVIGRLFIDRTYQRLNS
jgi:parallel beta-helix repeat protein